jgi:hypothetical protein
LAKSFKNAISKLAVYQLNQSAMKEGGENGRKKRKMEKDLRTKG